MQIFAGSCWKSKLRKQALKNKVLQILYITVGSSHKTSTDVYSQSHKTLLTHHDKVDQWDGIEADIPQPHDSEHIDQDHGNGEGHQHCRPQLKAQKHRRHHKDGHQWHTEVKGSVIDDSEVLFIEDVEYAVHGGKKRNVQMGYGPWWVNYLNTKIVS